MVPERGRVLVIDDDPDVATFLSTVCGKLGFAAETTSDSDEFWHLYQTTEPTVIVLDLMIPGVDGIELLRRLGKDGCDAPIIVISGADSRTITTAKRLGASYGLKVAGGLRKPLGLTAFEQILKRAADANRPLDRAELARAVTMGEFVLHYQPKADIADPERWKIVGCEALVRWDCPGRGLLMPDTFIPMAEETGLIAPLTTTVAEQAIGQLGRWRSEGLDLSMAINLAPQLVKDLTLPDRFAELVEEHGIERSQVTVEITESGAVGDAALSMDTLARFRLKGFGLSIDDFGTGHSSLVQLHQLPFNEIKIDRAFVRGIGEDAEAEKIVRSIAELAQGLGLRMCGEGVENETALDFLRSVHCEQAQGYLISRPVPPEDIYELVRGRGMPPVGGTRSERADGLETEGEAES